MSDFVAVLLVLVIWALMIWAGVAWVHYLADPHGPVDNDKRVGVRGWLTVLIGGFVAWGPLIGIARWFQEISQAERLYPALKSLPDWATFKSFIWILVVIFTAWQFHVGWRLCRERTPLPIAYLKQFLLISPLALLCFGLPNVLVLKLGYPFSEMLPGAVAVAIVNGIWFWYVAKSTRVYRTYNLGAIAARQTSVEMTPEALVNGLTKPRGDSDFVVGPGVEAPGSAARVLDTVSASVAVNKSVEERIAQHRLERSLGDSLDDALLARCLSECDSDQVRATALYRRRKAGLSPTE